MDLVSLPFCEDEFLHHTYGTCSFHSEAMKDRQASLGLHTGIWPNKLSWPWGEEGEPQAPPGSNISSEFSAFYFALFSWVLFSKASSTGASSGAAPCPDEILFVWNDFWGLLSLLRSGRFVIKQFLQKLWQMKISILCISMWKCWWEEAKQNISWVFSFSPNPKLEKSFFNWKMRVFT